MASPMEMHWIHAPEDAQGQCRIDAGLWFVTYDNAALRIQAHDPSICRCFILRYTRMGC